MGLLDYLDRAIDTVVTTVKNVVAPQSASATQKVKENIPMVSENKQAQQKNEDIVSISKKNVNSIYKQIEELCVDYRMNMEDVKQAGLLETIAGCSSKELAKKSDEEIKGYIDSLKFVLKWQSWKLPWKNRDAKDIKEIAQKANERCIYLKTGRNFVSNALRSRKTLSEKIKDAGYNEINTESVKALFQKITAKAIATGDAEKIKDAYGKALQTFGDLLNDTVNPEEKALLTSAISELESTHRVLATGLSIQSCMNNQKSQEIVAKGIADNYIDIAGKKDALGNYTSSDNNQTIAKTAFQFMNESDAIETINNWNKERESAIQACSCRIPISDEKRRLIKSTLSDGMAGATVGTAMHANSSSIGSYNKQRTIQEIYRVIKKAGLPDVDGKIQTYIKNHSNELPMNEQEIVDIINKATNGHYAATLANIGVQAKTKDFASSKNNSSAANTSTNNHKTQTSYNTKFEENRTSEAQNAKQTHYDEIKESHLSGITQETNTNTTKTGSRAKQAENFTTSPEKQNTNWETTKVSTKAYSPETKNEAIQGGVKTVKQFAKDNNVSTLDLAINSLNSSSASHATKKWALSQFEAATKSEQLLNFHKITRGSSALAAAKEMDNNTRSQITTFRSFYIKQAVENLNESALA